MKQSSAYGIITAEDCFMNILITGATKGIGHAIFDSLKSDNNIFTASRSSADKNEFPNHFSCDLSTKEGALKLGEYIAENKIDILINNAGGYIYTPAENTTHEDLHKILALNLETPLYLISKAIPYMKKQKFGRIINIGSISGVLGEANASAYSASKAGLIGASKALAIELAEYGITVNTINPGWVDTEMGNLSANEGDFSKEEITECIPQKRFVEPCEIAGMVKYLISPEAKGVTGQSINLCAGLTCGY